MSFSDFLSLLPGNPALIVTAVLTLSVILVNGWTDAPNAIATAVSTRALTPKSAVLMAAVCNFLGIFVMTSFNKTVAMTIYNMVDFGVDTRAALIALCAAMVSIVVWSVCAWFFGIPTSESHALVAGLTGAAIAIQGGTDAVNQGEWVKVIYGLILSTFLGFILGFFCSKLTLFSLKNADRRKTKRFFRYSQITATGAVAFMHGAQDGQKFIGIFLLGISLSGGNISESFIMPMWLIAICSVVMGIGTSIGGKKIIKSVGMDMVKLEPYQGFSADAAGAVCLLVSSLFGLPVSTTHTKTTAVMGVGAAKGSRSVDWSVAKDMVLAWVLTFPGCGIIGFTLTRLLFEFL